jgi:probable HAF family extracellular repeat protein
MTGVNDYGDIVGFYQKSDKSYHGFLWLHQNVIKTIDYPGTTFATVPMGVDSTLQTLHCFPRGNPELFACVGVPARRTGPFSRAST